MRVKTLGFLALLWSSIGFASSEPGLPLSLKHQDWFFTSDVTLNKTKIRIDQYLQPQIKDRPCCDGEYSVELPIELFQEFDSQVRSNLGIFLPSAGGLREIRVNHSLFSFSDEDYSSVGPIIAIPSSAFQEKQLRIQIRIKSQSNGFRGLWRGAPVIDTLPNLSRLRDANISYQVSTPLFFSVFFSLFILVFVWLTRRAHVQKPIYTEYFFGFLFWSIFFFFLSGVPRSVFPVFGTLFHHTARALAGIASYRIMATVAKSDRRRMNQITGALLIPAFLLSILSVFDSYELLQAAVLFTIHALGGVELLRLGRRVQRRVDWVFLLFAWFYILTSVSDSLQSVFRLFLMSYPFPYLMRFGVPPFLFMSIVYLVHHLLEEVAQGQRSRAAEELALQISHDIRSPLSAFEMILADLDEIPAEKRLIIRNSVNRVKEIANALLKDARLNASAEQGRLAEVSAEDLNQSEPPVDALVHLPALVADVMGEKQFQMGESSRVSLVFKSSHEAAGFFAAVNKVDFQRVLSNLLNNAIESFEGVSGKVEVILNQIQVESSSFIEILIRDDGKGIPAHVLSQLGQRGQSFGKANGNGLGLYHARMLTERWGGSFRIESAEGKGTEVSIQIPRMPLPEGWTSRIDVLPETALVLVVKNGSFFSDLEDRIRSSGTLAKSMMRIESFSEFRKWYGTHFADLDDALFLIEGDLLSSTEGAMDQLGAAGISEQVFIVCDSLDQAQLSREANLHGLKMVLRSDFQFVIKVN